MSLSDADAFGTAADSQRRSDLARIDDASTRKRVETARRLILKKNRAISNKDVEAELKDLSLTPTDVS